MIHLGPSDSYPSSYNVWYGQTGDYQQLNGWPDFFIKEPAQTTTAKRQVFYRLSVSYIVNWVQTGAHMLPSQLCSFQTFGYRFCKVQSLSLTLSSSSTASPLVLLQGSTVTVTIKPSVTIDDPGTITNRTPFCSLGSDLVIYQDGILLTNSTVVLNKTSLELSYVISPISPVLIPSTLQIGYRDRRDSSQQYVYSTLQFRDGTCSSSELSLGEVTFANLTAIEKVNYLQNSGTSSFSYSIAAPSCNGYIGMTVSLADEYGTTIYTDSASFELCKSATNTHVCFFHDTTLKILSYSSQFNSLSINDFKKVLTFTVTHSSRNIVGATITQQTLTPFIFSQTSCDYTVFTPNLVWTNATTQTSDFDFISASCTSQSESLTLNFADSVSASQQSLDKMSWCGKRKLDIFADPKDPNQLLAAQLLSGTLIDSYLSLTIDSASYEATISYQVGDVQLVNKSLSFLIQVSLQDYDLVVPGPNQSFPIKLSFPKNLSACKEKLCVVDSLAPETETTHINYTIGLGADFFRLPSYLQVPDCGYSLYGMSVVQSQGIVISENSFSTNLTTFAINIADTALENQVLEFTFTAILLDPKMTNNSDFKLRVTFLSVDQNLVFVQNTAPYFQMHLLTPPPIPCLADNAVLRWSYRFQRAIDTQNDKITFSKLSCPTIPEDFFIYSLQQDTMTLQVDANFPFQPAMSEEACKISLSDDQNLPKSYSLNFTIACSRNQTRSRSEFLVVPNPRILNIWKNGTIQIIWNADLVIPDRFLNNSAEYQNHSMPLKLSISRNSWPGNDATIKFTYQVTKYEKRMTELQIMFEEPLTVSNNNIKDSVTVIFNDSRFFTTIQNLSLPINFKLEGLLPIQETNNQFGTDPFLISQAVKLVLAFIALGFVMSFFLIALLNFLLSFVKSLALIIHLFVLSLNFPLNLKTFLSTLFPLVTFSLIPVDNLFDKIFHFDQIIDNNPISDQFDLSGYSSPFIVKNLGSLYCVINLTLAAIILSKCVSYWLKISEFHSAQCVVENLQNRVLWNGWIGFSYDNFIVIATAAFLESNDLRFGQSYTATENFCSVLAILAMTYSVAFPFVILFLYWSSFRKIQYVENLGTSGVRISYGFEMYLKSVKQCEAKMRQHGVLLERLNLRQPGIKVAVMTPFLDLMRQLILSVTITRLIAKPTLCIIVFNFNILFHLMFLVQFQPYKDKWDQALLFLNEGTLLVLNYFLFLFTPFVEQRHHPAIGDCVKVVILSNIALNMIIGGAKALQRVPFKIKLLYSKYLIRMKTKKMKSAKKASQIPLETIQEITNPHAIAQDQKKKETNQLNFTSRNQEPPVKLKSILKRTSAPQKTNQMDLIPEVRFQQDLDSGQHPDRSWSKSTSTTLPKDLGQLNENRGQLHLRENVQTKNSKQLISNLEAPSRMQSFYDQIERDQSVRPRIIQPGDFGILVETYSDY